MTDVDRILEALFDLDGDRLLALLRASSGGPFGGIDGLLVPALEKMGELWDKGDIALSQIYLAGKLCEEAAEQLFSLKGPDSLRKTPRIGLVVLDDYHMLGKRILYSVLHGSGYEVRDYGRKTVDELVSAVADDGIELLFVSTLMLPSALRVRELCSRLKTGPSPVTVVVGGAPFRFDANLWKEVGADGMGHSAADALEYVRTMAGSPKGAPK